MEKKWEVSVKAIYEKNVIRFKVIRKDISGLTEIRNADSWDEVLEFLDEWN